MDVAIDGFAASSRRHFGADLTSYILLNLAAGRDFLPGWRVDTRLGNLFDEHYELAHGYNPPGRNVHLRVLWRPQE